MKLYEWREHYNIDYDQYIIDFEVFNIYIIYNGKMRGGVAPFTPLIPEWWIVYDALSSD